MDGVDVRTPPREPQLDQPATVEEASDEGPSGESEQLEVIVPAGMSVHSLSSISITELGSIDKQELMIRNDVSGVEVTL